MGIIDDAAETSAIARSVNSTDGVYVVPAFTGLAHPDGATPMRGFHGSTGSRAEPAPGSHRARRAGIAGLLWVHNLAVIWRPTRVRLSVLLRVDGVRPRTIFSCSFKAAICARRCAACRMPRRLRARRRVRRLATGFLEGFEALWPSVFGQRRVRAGRRTSATRLLATSTAPKRLMSDAWFHPEWSDAMSEVATQSQSFRKDPVRRQPSRDEREEKEPT